MPIAIPVETISPELALVDERLNAQGRALLPDFPHRPAASTPPQPERTRVRWRVPFALAGCALLAAVTPGSSLSIEGSLTGEETQAGTATAAPSQEEPQTAAAGSRRLLRWRSVTGATAYNVIFWRDGKRALDLWPRKAAVPLPLRRLTSGKYQWFVYPVLRSRGEQRFGPLVARGLIRI